MIRLRQSDSHDGPLRDLTPDLTPMLDILFILLVFFMITAGVAFQSLDLKLPSGALKDLPVAGESGRILLEIRKDAYVIDGTVIADFAQLKNLVAEAIREEPRHELVIAGDRRVAIERLLKVLVYLRSQGVEAADILMRNEETQ